MSGAKSGIIGDANSEVPDPTGIIGLPRISSLIRATSLNPGYECLLTPQKNGSGPCVIPETVLRQAW
jgi:hypothetical protein